MNKLYKVGDRVRVITRPNDYEYRFEVGEVFVIKNILNGCYRPVDFQRGYIKAKNVELVPNKNVIGGKIL